MGNFTDARSFNGMWRKHLPSLPQSCLYVFCRPSSFQGAYQYAGTKSSLIDRQGSCTRYGAFSSIVSDLPISIHRGLRGYGTCWRRRSTRYPPHRGSHTASNPQMIFKYRTLTRTLFCNIHPHVCCLSLSYHELFYITIIPMRNTLFVTLTSLRFTVALHEYGDRMTDIHDCFYSCELKSETGASER